MKMNINEEYFENYINTKQNKILHKKQIKIESKNGVVKK